MWKTISSTDIFTHSRLSLIEDGVVLPNGQKTKYLKYKERGCAVVVIAKKDNKILILNEYAYPLNRTILQFPWGSVPSDESPETGAKREFKEETGFVAKQFDLLWSYYIESSRTQMKMYVYLATDLEEWWWDPNPEEEDLECYWFTENEITNMIKCGEIDGNHLLSAWCLYINSK